MYYKVKYVAAALSVLSCLLLSVSSYGAVAMAVFPGEIKPLPKGIQSCVIDKTAEDAVGVAVTDRDSPNRILYAKINGSELRDGQGYLTRKSNTLVFESGQNLSLKNISITNTDSDIAFTVKCARQ